MSERGERVLLTGASGGIGMALARRLATGGARVALGGRNADRLDALAAQLRLGGAEVLVLATDLSRPDACQEVVARVVGKWSGLDMLLLNAGTSSYARVAELSDPKLFMDLMAVNYGGPALLTFHALAELQRSRGRIVVVSSLQGKAGFPWCAAYSASKHALHGFFDSLRMELHGTGVRLTVVCPGPVATEIHDRAGQAVPAGMALMSPDRCAELILAAARRGRRELVMTAGGKLMTWLRPFAPGLVDSIIRKKSEDFFRGQATRARR